MRSKVVLTLLLVGTFSWGEPASARSLPVSAEGRLMPLETFAEQLYFEISGRAGSGEALEWLLEAVANPEQSRNKPALLINNPGAVSEVFPAATERRLYSYAELEAQGSVASAWEVQYRFDPSPEGRERARLGHALGVYASLLATLSPVPEAWNSPLRIFPVADRYVCPAELLAAQDLDQRSTDNLALLLLWQSSFKTNPTEASAALGALADRLADDSGWLNTARLELVHNSPWWTPALALVLLLGWLGSHAGPSPWRGRSLTLGLGAAAALTLGWMALRVIITGRPPVTNLPSTFLFVALVILLIGAALSTRPAHRTLASVLGASALVLALLQGLFVGGSDAFAPLQAVLNSNFWLSVHVPTIVLGYALLLVAGLVGHAGLFREVDEVLHWSLLGGLSFTVAGTLLGGVWADQSWGQFWSWDPKENGALLLILWSALVLHQRGRAKPWTVSLLAAILIPVLLFSWLGVNLLGQGSHTYGYSPGKGLIFLSLLAAEAVFLAVVSVRRVLT